MAYNLDMSSYLSIAEFDEVAYKKVFIILR